MKVGTRHLFSFLCSACCSAKKLKNYLKPFQQNRHQPLIAYCHNIYCAMIVAWRPANMEFTVVSWVSKMEACFFVSINEFFISLLGVFLSTVL
jgi:hypothetical protein